MEPTSNHPVPTTRDAAFEAVVACGRVVSALGVAAEVTGSTVLDGLCDAATEATDRFAKLCAVLGADVQPSYIAATGSMPCDLDEERLRDVCSRLVGQHAEEVAALVRQAEDAVRVRHGAVSAAAAVRVSAAFGL